MGSADTQAIADDLRALTCALKEQRQDTDAGPLAGEYGYSTHYDEHGYGAYHEDYGYGAYHEDYGYGAHYENNTFAMHPYCWCEEDNCPWCARCTCPEEAFTYTINNQEVTFEEFLQADPNAHRQTHHNLELACEVCKGNNSPAPNFWHKPTNTRITWYKYIGRDMVVDLQGDWNTIIADCFASIGRATPPPAGSPARLADEAASYARDPLMRELFQACAAQWDAGYDHESGEPLSARQIKITPIGRALLALVEAGDPAHEAYGDGFEAAAQQLQARWTYRAENMEYNQLENSDTQLWTHRREECAGENCTIHNRSQHPMRSFEQHWRADRAIMERICPHGIGHPDPDDYRLATGADNGTHGCDGCCNGHTSKEPAGATTSEEGPLNQSLLSGINHARAHPEQQVSRNQLSNQPRRAAEAERWDYLGEDLL